MKSKGEAKQETPDIAKMIMANVILSLESYFFNNQHGTFHQKQKSLFHIKTILFLQSY